MEHRHETRTSLMVYLDVRNAQDGMMLGHVGDISEHGMMLITHQAIGLGKQYDIRIELPDTVPLEREVIEATINTLWEKPNLNPRQHCIGCTFVNFPAQSAKDLRTLGEYLGFAMNMEIHRVSDS